MKKFDNLPAWAVANLSGADPEPTPPPGEPPVADDPDIEAGRKALALVRTQGVRTAIGQLAGKDGKPKYQWADVDTVYALLDRDKVEVDLDTGAVSGLDDQLEALAKSKPFLLQQEQPPAPQAIGTPPVGGLTGHHEDKTTAASLAQEHPGTYGPLSRLAGIPSK